MSVALTKTEARQLARKVRQRGYGMYRIDAHHVEIACPLDEHLDRRAHCVEVWHKPWEKITAPMIDAAFIKHYCSPYEDERCTAL
jgi:hypothetical protein